METPSIAQELCAMKEKAQVLGSLLISLQGHIQAANNNQPLQKHNASVQIIWSELEHSIATIAEEFEYLRDLSQQHSIAELLHALDRP